MSQTILEDRKVWGSIPHEITYAGATITGLGPGVLVFAEILRGLWIFLPVTALVAVATIMRLGIDS